MEYPEFISIHGLRKIVDLPDRTLFHQIATGKFPAPAFRAGRCRYWSAADVRAWLDNQRDCARRVSLPRNDRGQFSGQEAHAA